MGPLPFESQERKAACLSGSYSMIRQREMTRCGQAIALAVCIVTTLFVATLRADDDHIRYTIAFRAENPWPVGVLGMIDPDGSRQKFLDFKRPKQKGWQWGSRLPDGRVILTSLEAADVAEIRAGKVVSHSWLYSFASGKLTKLLERDPLSKNIYVQTVLPGERRLLALVFLEGEQRLYEMDLDGGNPVALTKPGEGFCYGVSLSPDGKRVAMHVTGGGESPFNPGHYSINVIDLATRGRSLVSGAKGHLYFGPQWSPDGKWLAFLDCHADIDPRHFSADLCIARPDGSEHRVVTSGRRHWFGTGYGSNVTSWSPDGKTITYCRLLPGSTTSGKGGTQICLLNPFTGDVTELNEPVDGDWHCRLAWSPDGRQLAFVKSGTRGRELWLMDADGRNAKLLTRGLKDQGADHPAWLPSASDRD